MTDARPIAWRGILAGALISFLALTVGLFGSTLAGILLYLTALLVVFTALALAWLALALHDLEEEHPS